MLNVMRRGANSWVIKILLVFIALSFVVWGVGDDLGRTTQTPLVEAKNWTITPREYSLAYDTEFQRMRQRFGGTLDKKMAEVLGLKQQTLNALINQHLIQEAGQQLRLTISPETLRKAIAENPAFQSGGTFDKGRYDLLLRNNRLTPAEYESQLTTELLTNQLRQAVGLLAYTPEILVRDSFELANESRQIATMTLRPADLENTFHPDDATLQAYLSEHIDQFMSSAQVKVRHILLNTDSVRGSITVSQKALQDYYDENLDSYIQQETREARHILIKIKGDVDEATALETIQLAEKRLQAGESFEAVAKELSQDISAAQGGSLGEFGRGMMVKPFEEATFSLAEGERSKPIKTQFGYHLIQVDKIHPGRTKTLAEVTQQIQPLLIERQAANQVYDRSITMEDQIFASGDLKTISADLNLRYRETDFFSRTDTDKLEGIEKEGPFLDAAFSTPKGEISPVIELPDNRFFALEVLGKKEPAPRSLKEAREEVLSAYRKERAREKAREWMEAAQKALSEGKSWQDAAKSHQSIQTKESAPFTRDGGKDAPSPAIRAAAFKLSLKKADHPDLIEEGDGFTLVRLQKITPANPEEYEKSAQALREKLQQTLGMEHLTSYLNGLWKKSDIRINNSMLDQF
ncbi:MAG: SurA N-terminal domain-containing protein [Magnetococcales bacterium]|nr:SurA N-terminal domain-containing protein [Magnetococcales bacterium]